MYSSHKQVNAENGHHCFQYKLQPGATATFLDSIVFLALLLLVLLLSAHEPHLVPCDHLGTLHLSSECAPERIQVS